MSKQVWALRRPGEQHLGYAKTGVGKKGMCTALQAAQRGLWEERRGVTEGRARNPGEGSSYPDESGVPKGLFAETN